MRASPAAFAVLAASVSACSALLNLPDRELADTPPDASIDGPPPAEGGTKDANPSSCDASVATDALNCGACGHSCAGSRCVNAMCEPIELRAGQNHPRGIVVDTTSIYWVDYGPPGTVWKSSKTNGTAASSVFTSSAPLAAIATDQTSLFIVGEAQGKQVGTDIITLSKFGTKQNECVHSTALGGLSSAVLSVNANVALFSADPDRVVATCTATPTALLVQTSGAVSVLADPSHTYFILRTGELYAGSSAGTGFSKALTIDAPGPMAGDGNHVYWIQKSIPAGGELAVATPDLHVSAAPTGLPDPITALAVDATGVYMATKSAIAVCPLSGCANGAKVIARPAQTTAIALDSDFVYFVTDLGLVAKVAK